MPWNSRRYGGGYPSSARNSFAIDCDRIVHCETFRDLQHKTQVQGLIEAPTGAFRTRLNHVIEVSQLAIGIAAELDADGTLAKAIALAHDLGHPPFGHAGERALRDALLAHGEPGWDANAHSLAVVDEIECAFIDFRGLNLTWATREGIARHSTPFDEPATHAAFDQTPNGGMECQIADAADILAYLSHDLDDAIRDGFVSLNDLREAGGDVEQLVSEAEGRWGRSLSPWPEQERARLIRRYVVAKLIERSIKDITAATKVRLEELAIDRPGAVRSCEHRVVVQSPAFAESTTRLLTLLTERYYRSSAVTAADSAATSIILGLFDWYFERPAEIPERFTTDGQAVATANFIASLNDNSAARLAEDLGLVRQLHAGETAPRR
jgi:dGTPase